MLGASGVGTGRHRHQHRQHRYSGTVVRGHEPRAPAARRASARARRERATSSAGRRRPRSPRPFSATTTTPAPTIATPRRRSPARLPTDRLHASYDFTITFDEKINWFLVSFSNDSPQLGGFDFGIAPTQVGGAVVANGSQLQLTGTSGGWALFTGLDTTTMSHANYLQLCRWVPHSLVCRRGAGSAPRGCLAAALGPRRIWVRGPASNRGLKQG